MARIVTAIGLMSGTSMDGVDAAILVTDGKRVIEPGATCFLEYGAPERAAITNAIDAARLMTGEDAQPEPLAYAERLVTNAHITAVRALLDEAALTSKDIDLIGFHGQTVLHAPRRGISVQLGDGSALACACGINVINDLRASDIAHGGEGAPLAPVYHAALGHSLSSTPVCFVNIGGVANVTWIGEDAAMVAFDTGPGNALLDDWALIHLKTPIDRDGALAAQGVCDDQALETLNSHGYFARPAPKSLDRNAFDLSAVSHLSPADGAATLLAFTVGSIARARDWFPQSPELWIICGGGRHNKQMMTGLKRQFGSFSQRVVTAEEAGFDGDFIEAQAFAYMAVRSRAKLPITFPGTTGVKAPQMGGVLHHAIPR